MNLNTVIEYIHRATSLREMGPERETPAFFVAGPVNSGKSTLINNLLDQRICPDDASPSTMFPDSFGYSETPLAHKAVKGRIMPLPPGDLRETLRKRRLPMPERAEILLPSGILRWCSLVDTPGIGLTGEIDGSIRNDLRQADGIIFLFHQRGMDNATYQFLNALAKHKLRGWISFWLNANHGPIDGTSLTETRQALKGIFPGRAEIYATNTRDRSSTDLISLFLQVKAMDFSIRGIDQRLLRLDRTIPGKLERSSMVGEDKLFLLKLWDVMEEAEIVNRGRQAVRDLPLIYGNMVNKLHANTCRLTTKSRIAPGIKKAKSVAQSPGEQVWSLVKEIQSDKNLAGYLNGISLRKAESLREKCRVMVAGPFSTGKTTFLNALLGETLLPAEDRATTSCPVRLCYGHQKAAEVDHLFKAEFTPVDYLKGKCNLNREEVLTLTQILENPSLRDKISGAEVCRNGLYKGVTLSELAVILDQICQSHGKNTAGAEDDKIRRIPLFSRRVADHSLLLPPVTGVRITVGNGGLKFRLDDDGQRLDFYRAISPPGSFLAERVSISHPSENLSFSDFIDTPGLDSLHKRHHDRSAAAMSSGDLALLFLHAKHVLAEGIPGSINIIKDLGLKLPVFYVINFADTISDVEREKVSLYIRQKLGQHTGTGDIAPYPQVYAISALNALHRGDEGFDRLLRRVRKKIADIEMVKITEATNGIVKWLKSIASGDPSGGRQNIPVKARQTAGLYLEELKGILKKL